MLRKRSRPHQKGQYMGNLMADAASESYFQFDTLGLRHKSSSIFNIPGLFVGFNTKGSSDSDSVRSPTSPLDFRVFLNLSNPFSFRSPRSSSSQNGPQKRWGCSKVGLGIVKSLTDETKPSGEVVDSSKGKNILFGPQMKINIPNSSSHYYESFDSSMKTNSLPKDYMVLPNSQFKTPNLQLGSSDAVFGIGKVPLEPEPFGKTAASLSNSDISSSSLTGLTRNLNLSSKSFCSEHKNTEMNSPPVIGEGLLLDNSLGVQPSSLPIPIGSGHQFVGSLSASEIELSEDYTCIISHGPHPKTTHIFGDCILECHTNELANFGKREEQGIELPQVAKSSDSSTPYPSDEFLSVCYSCKKKLEEGKDIYMYRGEKAFCSFNCRSDEIFVEEEMEKTANSSSESSPETSYLEDLFLTGMPFAT